MPDSEKKPERLVLELMAIMGAGTATTSWILTLTTYHILADPAKEKRLREELQEVMSDFPERMPRWAELEKLPYLTACLKEGLR
jgi:cytochrome P450